MFNFEKMSDKDLVTLWISLNYNELLTGSNISEISKKESNFLAYNSGFSMWYELEVELNKRDCYYEVLQETCKEDV